MAEQALRVVRKELKYSINYFEYVTLSGKLYNVLKEDPNNGEGGYLVRSLYFDSYSDTDFYAKLAGLENRKKIRLRIYKYDNSKVKLEIKRKYGNNQKKDTVSLSREDAQSLIEMDYEVLRKYDSDVAANIYNIMKLNRLRPVVLIEYRRKAFIHPMNNIRITLDTEIKSNETSFEFFAKEPILAPTEDYFQGVLEVKYNDFIYRWITDIFAAYDLDRQSYSKYMVSRGLFERYMA